MSGDERQRQLLHVEFDERAEFAKQHHDQANGTIVADARILHDAEDLGFLPAAAEAVDHVAPAVLMENAGNAQGGNHRRQHGQRLRPEIRGADKDQRTQAADDQADQRHVTRRFLQGFTAMPDPGRDRQPCEEADCTEEGFKFLFKHSAFSLSSLHLSLIPLTPCR